MKLIAILIPITVGMFSALFSGNASMTYEMMNKPPLSPPGEVFPIVWTILYLLMGLSSYLVYQTKKPFRENGLLCYIIQLAFNFFWSIWFFQFELYLFSFIWLLVMICFVFCMIIRFYKVVPLAGLLQIPYLLWCFFAAYLNWKIYLLNL